MRNVIASLSAEDRLKYDYGLLEEKYIENQSRLVEDDENVKQLTEIFAEKKILLVAPGKSSVDSYEKVQTVLKEKNVITIAVNAILPDYKYDYLFSQTEYAMNMQNLHMQKNLIIQKELYCRM